MFAKPSDMFDRDEEWAALSRFAADDRSGATLGVVSGRRRQGKTFLLDALSKADGGFFFEATEATDTESLRQNGAQLGYYTRASMPPRPADWRGVLDALLALGAERPVTVVIDEFPYLARANPELPSVIQAAFGPRREERLNSRTRLLLCGSAMSFMGRLLSETAPARGRGRAGDGRADLGLPPGRPVLEDRRSAPGGLAVLDSRRHASLPGRGRRRPRSAVRGGPGPLGGGERPEQVQPALPRGPLPARRGTPTSGTTPSTTPFSAPSPRATAPVAASPVTWSARPPTSPTTCRYSRTPACSPATSTSSAPAGASTESASR